MKSQVYAEGTWTDSGSVYRKGQKIRVQSLGMTLAGIPSRGWVKEVHSVELIQCTDGNIAERPHFTDGTFGLAALPPLANKK